MTVHKYESTKWVKVHLFLHTVASFVYILAIDWNPRLSPEQNRLPMEDKMYGRDAKLKKMRTKNEHEKISFQPQYNWKGILRPPLTPGS